jgi:hypothetical protein
VPLGISVVTVRHHGFARAVAGERTEIIDWQPIPVADDPIGRYGAVVDHVLESFAAVPTSPRENSLSCRRSGAASRCR